VTSQAPKRSGRAIAFALVVALLTLAALEATLYPHKKPVFPWHHLPGYAALFGLLGCLVVVALAKGLGKAFLQGAQRDD
jgi:hypothetical protein